MKTFWGYEGWNGAKYNCRFGFVPVRGKWGQSVKLHMGRFRPGLTAGLFDEWIVPCCNTSHVVAPCCFASGSISVLERCIPESGSMSRDQVDSSHYCLVFAHVICNHTHGRDADAEHQKIQTVRCILGQKDLISVSRFRLQFYRCRVGWPHTSSRKPEVQTHLLWALRRAKMKSGSSRQQYRLGDLKFVHASKGPNGSEQGTGKPTSHIPSN